MKKIIREPKSEEITIGKVENYQDLYNSDNEIRDRWNSGSKANTLLKETLLQMSSHECVYCGKKISVADFDVEHFLPKKKFPYLSYSYDNLLASCKKCNQNMKRDIYPKSLETIRKTLGEGYLVGQINGVKITEFKKSKLFSKTTDRIIDPSFDTPEEHIEFNPSTCEYTMINNSEIGNESKNMFFRENKIYVEELQVLSAQIIDMMREGSSKETILNLSKISGYSYQIEKIYEYWKDFLG